MPDSPFADYLRAIDAQLAGLPPTQRAAIRQELLAHLEDAAADANADPHDPTLQAAIIAQLGPADDLAGSVDAARLHQHPPTVGRNQVVQIHHSDHGA